MGSLTRLGHLSSCMISSVYDIWYRESNRIGHGVPYKAWPPQFMYDLQCIWYMIQGEQQNRTWGPLQGLATSVHVWSTVYMIIQGEHENRTWGPLQGLATSVHVWSTVYMIIQGEQQNRTWGPLQGLASSVHVWSPVYMIYDTGRAPE